jgi:hypothetical protein
MVSWYSRKQIFVALSSTEASTFHYVWKSLKERLFEIFLQTYLDMRWTPTLSIAITRVV